MAPRVLVIDDLVGRDLHSGPNRDRENLCAQLSLHDVTGDACARARELVVPNPVAEAVFFRGQRPTAATFGDRVENDMAAVLAKVRSGWDAPLANSELPWAMVLLDLSFKTGRITAPNDARDAGMPESRASDSTPDEYFGLQILEALKREFPKLPVFILSGQPRHEVGLAINELGALGFIARENERGDELLAQALWQHGLLPDESGKVVGHALSLLLALRDARRLGKHRAHVLIRGERGTGKELMAKLIHQWGATKSSGRMFTINCATLTQEMATAELYGIEDRTATGVAGRMGLVETAHGGDLFLDEIGDTVPGVQAKLMRALEEGEIVMVGGRRIKVVDVRFLAATNMSIESEAGGFRLDLLDRLREGGTVQLPPLRERRGDISLLARKFVHEADSERNGILERQITSEALEMLEDYPWTGNVRELRQRIFEAVRRHPDLEYLVPNHLSLRDDTPRPAPAISVSKPAVDMPSNGGSAPGLETLLVSLRNFQFDRADIKLWKGKLPELQRGVAELLARYLHAALEATKHVSSESPEGVIRVQPAAKLMTGNETLTGAEAADLIKRLLKPLESDLSPELAEVLKKVRNSRRGSRKTATAAD
jgi:DNA-binding NtrC family response regulator